jgi:hypothetical protein
MTLPVHFATLHGGPQALSLLDRQFAAVGALTTIPCTYSSPDGNVITLTPYDNTPTIWRYTDLAPSFIFTALASNSFGVTISVMGWPQPAENDFGSQPPGSGWPQPPTPVPLGSRVAYKAGGAQPLVKGDIVEGNIYRATFGQALNAGLGGWSVDTVTSLFTPPDWQAYIPTVTSTSGAYGSATASGSWLQQGHIVFLTANVSVAAKGSGAGELLVSLPTAAPIIGGLGMGRNEDTGVIGAFTVGAGQTTAQFSNYDNSDPVAASGASDFLLSMFYGV